MTFTVFQDAQAQRLVDAILLGYNQYLQLRIQKAKELEVSGGFAWTKTNYIEDAVFKGHHDVMTCKKKKAGQTWEYLEFDVQTEHGRTLIIIKSGARLPQVYGKTAKEKSKYLYKMAEINRSYIDRQRDLSTKPEMAIQLELMLDLDMSVDNVYETSFDRFLIITYEVNQNDKRLLSAIKIYMPDPVNEVLREVQDLSVFMKTSTVEPIHDSEDVLKHLADKDVQVEDFDIVPLEQEQTAYNN